MIKSVIINDRVIRHYSDKNVMIKQVETGDIFPDAIDVIPCEFSYEETDIPIADTEIDEFEVFSILFGGDDSA